jgi:hypothetical protein
MKKSVVLAAALSLLVPATYAADAAPPAAPASTPGHIDDAAAAAKPATANESPKASDMCFYAHRPTGDVRYDVLDKVKEGKQTYGSVRDLLPRLAAEARKSGGDAIVDYDAGQHFGFWPWRMVRPIAHGTIIKWAGQAPDCSSSGGKWLSSILVDNVAPNRN